MGNHGRAMPMEQACEKIRVIIFSFLRGKRLLHQQLKLEKGTCKQKLLMYINADVSMIGVDCRNKGVPVKWDESQS